MPSRKHSAPRRTTRKAKTSKPPTLTPEEVKELELQVASHRKSEDAWLKMTEASPEDDPWGAVEEHLLNKPHESHHALRRWKYFSK